MDGKFVIEDGGQPALLYLRDASGIDYVCGAILSKMRSATSREERDIVPGEELSLVSIEVVVQ